MGALFCARCQRWGKRTLKTADALIKRLGVIYAVTLFGIVAATIGVFGALGWGQSFQGMSPYQVALTSFLLLIPVLGGLTLLAILTFVTVRKAITNAEAASGETVQRSLVPEYSGDATVRFDKHGRLESINDTVTRILGWTIEDVRGKRPCDVLRESGDLAQLEQQILSEIGEKISWRREVQMDAKDGSLLWVDMGINIVTSEDGKIEQMVAVFRDISEMVHYRTKLEKTIARANAADSVRNQFLTNMSHELRTPINGIMGMNYLLLHSELRDDQKEYAKTVQASSEHLLHVINNILDLSKMESGQLELAAQPFSLDELINSSLDAVRDSARRKGLALSSHVPFSDQTYFEGDVDRVRQLLINILANAVKFTLVGEISLSVEESEKGIAVSITDTGPGILPEDMPRLFDRFYQVDGSVTREQEGSGLGLAICKEIIERMRGTITVDSVRGQGTTFRIDIPLMRISDRRQINDRRQGSIDLPNSQTA